MATRSLLPLFVLVLLGSTASAQAPAISVVQAAQERALGEALSVGAFTVQDLQLQQLSQDDLVTPVILGGDQFTLSLSRWSVRSPRGFQVLAHREDGSYEEVEAGPSTVWRGRLLEVPGSRVSASWDGDSLDALIRLGDDLPLWAIQPARVVSPDHGPAEHVVYSAADNLILDARCGGTPGAIGGLGQPKDTQGTHGASGYAGLADDVICEIACDADFEFFTKNGSSVAATEADIENIIDRVQLIYQAEVSILYEITAIIVRTAEPDPYTSSDSDTLLDQMRTHWNANHADIPRDVAQLFTGRNLSGGVIGLATLATICNVQNAFGVVESLYTPNIIMRTALSAHELGHNWSAGHCNGSSDCQIMCAIAGGCGGLVTGFGTQSEASITAFRDAIGCLEDAVPPPPPVITGVTPDSLSALGGAVTLTGLNLLKVTQVDVGGATLTGSALIPISDTTLTFIAPPALALGNQPVTATNVSGTSPAAGLTYQLADPPLFDQPSLVNTLADTEAVWRFATTPGDLCFFLISFDPTTFLYKGYGLLANPIEIFSLPINGAGVGSLSVPIDPSMGGVGLYFVYTQMAFVAPPLRSITPAEITSVF
jgi:hypothetical protein